MVFIRDFKNLLFLVIIEGDIVADKNLLRIIQQKKENRQKRAALKTAHLWDGALIPYSIAPDVCKYTQMHVKANNYQLVLRPFLGVSYDRRLSPVDLDHPTRIDYPRVFRQTTLTFRQPKNHVYWSTAYFTLANFLCMHLKEVTFAFCNELLSLLFVANAFHKAVRRAFRRLAAKTCIRFVPKNKTTDKHFIHFRKGTG